jgi:hypothetical protein
LLTTSARSNSSPSETSSTPSARAAREVVRRHQLAHAAEVPAARQQDLREHELRRRDGVDRPRRHEHDVARDERRRERLHVARRIEDGAQRGHRREVRVRERRHAPRREDDLDVAQLVGVRVEVLRVHDVRVEVRDTVDLLAGSPAEHVAVRQRILVE